MNKSIILYLWPAILLFRPNDAFNPETWLKNADDFSSDAVLEISNTIFYEKYDGCRHLGRETINQLYRNLIYEFDHCHENEKCYFEKEKSFHQRIEDIKVETALCASFECDYFENINRTYGIHLQCKDEDDLKNSIETAVNCTYTREAKVLPFGLNRESIQYPNQFSCELLAQVKIRMAENKAVEGLLNCKETMLAALKEKFANIKKCSKMDIHNEFLKMLQCSKVFQDELKLISKKVNDELYFCYPPLNG